MTQLDLNNELYFEETDFDYEELTNEVYEIHSLINRANSTFTYIG